LALLTFSQKGFGKKDLKKLALPHLKKQSLHRLCQSLIATNNGNTF
jgi:hypothetical protein